MFPIAPNQAMPPMPGGPAWGMPMPLAPNQMPPMPAIRPPGPPGPYMAAPVMYQNPQIQVFEKFIVESFSR